MAAAHDVVASMLAWWLAFLLRFNFEVPREYLGMIAQTLPVVVIVQTGVFWYFGLYRGIWRYASLSDFKRIVLSVVVASALVTALLLMLRTGVPRSVLVLDPILLAFSMAGSRMAYRLWRERRQSRRLPFHRQPVLVLGAGEAGAKLVAELALNREWRVVGVLDDDRKKHGRHMHG